MTTALLALPTSPAASPPILWFEDAAAGDPARAGGKAAALAALARRLPVPDGFVVAGTPDDATVEEAYVRLGERAGTDDPLVAVRSSAADEDGLASSFAGQHETILGVRGIDQVLDAIAACRASAHTQRALHYRRANGLAPPRGPLPVLVQLLVPADAAAVVDIATQAAREAPRDPAGGARPEDPGAARVRQVARDPELRLARVVERRRQRGRARLEVGRREAQPAGEEGEARRRRRGVPRSPGGPARAAR
ncbi:MAG: PEP/pyruvate-binding domain-containing protein, partial [Actinobacteria bacterium]|nr:PEP/pyruvate-binding domain-containing protein [Actinomycetota bacterium]